MEKREKAEEFAAAETALEEAKTLIEGVIEKTEEITRGVIPPVEESPDPATATPEVGAPP